MSVEKADPRRAMPVESLDLHVPNLEELCDVIKKGLQENYKESSCTVVDCPDLSKEPFGLASSGICGKTRLIEVGGVPNLVPLAKYKEKVYDLQDISEKVKSPGCLIIGAGAGSKHVVGVNCEMMPNIKCDGAGHETVNLVHISKVIPEDQSHVLESYDVKYNSSSEFGILANLFCSEGKQDKVLAVRAKCRTGTKDLVGCMRNAIKQHYGSHRPVGMGGVFLVKEGKVKIHVMPDFPTAPMTCDTDVNNWLNFYEVSSPFMVLSTFITEDMGLDLRFEHSHGYSKSNGTGGHYHTDVTPEQIEYIGYFVPAQSIYRVDRPQETHQIGRDRSVSSCLISRL